MDNGSTDESAAFVREKWGPLISKIIENNENVGYARGSNQGIHASHGEYIAFLNNDVRLDPRWIAEMVSCAGLHPDAGMYACKILLAHDLSLIDNTGHLIYPDGLNFSRGRLEKDRGQFDRIEEVLFPSGAASLFHRTVVADAGGFDEDFFAYGDDADLGLRARLRGWSCVYVPKAVAVHRHSATAGEYSAFKAYLVERNRIWVAVKCFPAAALAFSPFYSAIRYVYQAYGVLSRQGAAGQFPRPLGLLWTLFRAWAGALKGLPKMLAKRRMIRRGRKLTSREFSSLLKRFGIGARAIALTP